MQKFWSIFWISVILGMIVALTYRLPDYILTDFHCDLDLENSNMEIWNLLYISQKCSNCHEMKSKHIDWALGLKYEHQFWPWPWPWPWFCYILAKNGPAAWNEKQTYWLKFRLKMWPSRLTLAMTLTLNFQGQIWNLLYLNQKWSICHKTKSKYINRTPGLKFDQWIWLWPWPLNF